jgi:flagellar hook-basal body complex protein FliE
MAISAITGAVAGINPALPSLPALPGTGTTPPAAGKDFGASLVGALDDLQAAHANVDDLAVKAATGDLTDVHDYTIAATQASLATELAMAVRNRGVESFNQIMSMPL